MNAVAKKTADRTDYQARARALRADRATQTQRAALEGRTLDTAPSADLTSEERVARMARTSSAFEGL